MSCLPAPGRCGTLPHRRAARPGTTARTRRHRRAPREPAPARSPVVACRPPLMTAASTANLSQNERAGSKSAGGHGLKRGTSWRARCPLARKVLVHRGGCSHHAVAVRQQRSQESTTRARSGRGALVGSSPRRDVISDLLSACTPHSWLSSMELGEHCSFPDCRQLDFLPFGARANDPARCGIVAKPAAAAGPLMSIGEQLKRRVGPFLSPDLRFSHRMRLLSPRLLPRAPHVLLA